MKLTFQWRAAVKKHEDKVKKEEGLEEGGGDERHGQRAARRLHQHQPQLIQQLFKEVVNVLDE